MDLDNDNVIVISRLLAADSKYELIAQICDGLHLAGTHSNSGS